MGRSTKWKEDLKQNRLLKDPEWGSWSSKHDRLPAGCLTAAVRVKKVGATLTVPENTVENKSRHGRVISPVLYWHFQIKTRVSFQALAEGPFKNILRGVPIVAQRKCIWLASMRTQVRSLALLSGLRIRHCQELWCRSQTWLWCRPAATALIWPLAWKSPYTASVALKKKKRMNILRNEN